MNVFVALHPETSSFSEYQHARIGSESILHALHSESAALHSESAASVHELWVPFVPDDILNSPPRKLKNTADALQETVP